MPRYWYVDHTPLGNIGIAFGEEPIEKKADVATVVVHPDYTLESAVGAVISKASPGDVIVCPPLGVRTIVGAERAA